MSKPELPGKYIYYTRKFLNRPGFDSVAAVFAVLNRDGYPEFKISDCHRDISLDLSNYDVEGDTAYFENCLFKLEMIERAAHGLRLAMMRSAKKKGYVPTGSNHE